ncbi:alcohol dehydrogenase catalytic domain-containing protein [Nocardioides halotolerans]|uniref:alcohol dehydrogenase catalytic domain-containing protein n=1 Tax=Nocardioides halotolerans TaxID=433660 RepID=UPI00146E143B|nr:alcohol dehydrogenase catalytic domain-containing protein [Nocardioides halotolerans]
MRVAVEACGVCFHDVLNRRGAFPRTRFPAVLGHEVAGVVDAVGAGVDDGLVGRRVALLQNQPCGACEVCRRGDEVLCRAGGGYVGEESPGGYASAVIVRATALVPVPEGVEPTAAAITACALGTSWQALSQVARVRPGEHALVTGAGGGVGLHAVRLAAHLGAEVVAVTTSSQKADAIRANGASHVVVASDGRFAAAVKELTGGGADVVLDPVGEVVLVEALHALRPGGRHVLLGNVTGDMLKIPAGLVMLKGLALLSSVGVTAAGLAELLGLVADRIITPTVAEVVPLAEAERCHRLLEQRRVTGRLVLAPERAS